MKKRFYTGLAGKVILASIVAMISVYAIHTAMIHAFDEITVNIDQLARPNDRLLAVNRLFRDVSHLNHSQQEESASKRRSPSLAFVNESKAIYQTIDTLRLLFAGDTLQLARLDQIENKLMRRERLFIDYLELQYRANLSPTIRQYISNISKNAKQDTNNVTSKVVQVYETTTSTTVSQDTLKQESSPGFFYRLFGGREISTVAGVVRSETRVNKEYKVIVDTIEVKRNDAIIVLLENSMDSLESSQLQQLARIQQQELELLNTNSSLIQEINLIINTVEQEEITLFGEETRSTFDIARATIKNLNYLAIAFITLSTVLVLLIIIDISRSNKYRKKLEQANNEARREAEAKQRFLSNMSHEIRTPLQSIYGYAELARLNPEQTIDIDTIYHSAGHLLNVVNEVLDYAKVTSGRISLDKVPFNPHSEIKSVVTAMQTLAQRKKLRLTLENNLSESLTLSGDPFRLRQIVFNLTGNAVKFTNKGEIRVNVNLKTVELQKSNAQLIVQVIDTGVGIPENQLPHLFQEYTRSDPTEKTINNGTGLGLSIVKKLTEIQNGTIEVESSPENGSCFTVTIPYEIIDVKPAATPENKYKGEDLQFQTRMVLLADDDPTILNLSSAILSKVNVAHKIFTNGQDLLDAFFKDPDALIFLDVHMPGMSGPEVCRNIRKNTHFSKKIKIYALTAQALPEERHSILMAGFDGVIIKPFKESDILNVLGKKSTKTNGVANSTRVDIRPLMKMIGNDEQQLKMILRTIIRESRNDLGELKKSLDKSHYETLALLVHRMAGRVGQAGAGEYALTLRKLETELRNGVNSEKVIPHVNEALKQGDYFIRDVKGQIDILAPN